MTVPEGRFSVGTSKDTDTRAYAVLSFQVLCSKVFFFSGLQDDAMQVAVTMVAMEMNSFFMVVVIVLMGMVHGPLMGLLLFLVVWCGVCADFLANLRISLLSGKFFFHYFIVLQMGDNGFCCFVDETAGTVWGGWLFWLAFAWRHAVSALGVLCLWACVGHRGRASLHVVLEDVAISGKSAALSADSATLSANSAAVSVDSAAHFGISPISNHAMRGQMCWRMQKHEEIMGFFLFF